MKCLITGGAGFIGSHLADRLVKDGHKIAILDNLSTGKKENLNKKANFYKIDICDSKICQIFKKEKPEIVFHLAAQVNVRKSVESPMEDAKINILGFINILENCRKFGIKKIIFASSGGAIYGEADIIPTSEDYPTNPLSPYGVAKLSSEKYLTYYSKIFGLPFISLRFSNVYGPRQSSKGEAGVIAIFCEKMFSGIQPIIHGNGKKTRDFVFVEDVVSAILLSAQGTEFGIFNVGTSKETSINDIFFDLKKFTKSKCQEVHGLESIGEQKRSCLDCNNIKRAFNWKTKYDLIDGLKKTVHWFGVQKLS